MVSDYANGGSSSEASRIPVAQLDVHVEEAAVGDIVIDVADSYKIKRKDTSKLTNKLSIKNQLDLRFSDLDAYVPQIVTAPTNESVWRKTSQS